MNNGPGRRFASPPPQRGPSPNNAGSGSGGGGGGGGGFFGRFGRKKNGPPPVQPRVSQSSRDFTQHSANAAFTSPDGGMNDFDYPGNGRPQQQRGPPQRPGFSTVNAGRPINGGGNAFRSNNPY